MKEGLRSSVNGVNVDGDGDGEGEGELCRTRKRVEGSNEKDDDGGGDDGVVSNGIVNRSNDSGAVMGDDSGRIEDSAVSSPEMKIREEMRECEHLGCGDNATNTDFDGHANANANANADAGQSGGVATGKKRGRKRKKTEVSRLEDGTAVLDAMTQVNGRVLRSRTMASANGVSVENVDGKTQNGIEDVAMQPSKRKRKRKRGRRGRPPKVDAGKEVSRVVASRKKKAFGSREKLRERSNELLLVGVKTEDFKSAEPCKSNANESNEEKGAVRKEDKQLLREQIMEMLLKAGWTIDYRPRNGREYHDAVYVDHEGRTYWSITKAYKKLKETVDNGVADAQETAAFAVIPDEVFSKLFRVVGKKRNDWGTKKPKGVTEKKLAQNKPSSRKITYSKSKLSSRKLVDSKCREKSNLSPNSRGRKPRLNQEEGRNKKRYALLARGSENGPNPDGSGFVLYDGKRSLLSWMIDLGTITQSAKVLYLNPRKTRVLLEGKITGDGIRCGCCNVVHTILSFEVHAGSKLGQPFENIYLKSGRSLFECLVDSWSKQEKIDKIEFCSVDVAGDDPNDDTCNICGDGGDLICCDGCPSTFHQSCLGIEHFPTGEWHCLYCSCKFCGTIGGNTSQNDDNRDKSVAKLFTCRLCEEKCHMTCIEGKDAPQANSKTPSFCGEGCQKLFNSLQKLLGVRHELDEGFSWTILQRCDAGKGLSLSDEPLKVECNSKLAVAFSVMDECFLPIVDQRSKSNMIHNVVYSCGSNFRRLNYSGFYTIVLERGDEIISAASIRMHGTQLAEMPFIATRYRYRRQGMCRRLLSAVETALCSLDVDYLLIPAISELMETWTKIFGFMPLEESKRREMRFMSMIVFPGTDMLQKPLQKHQLTTEKMVSATGSMLRTESEPKAEDQTVNELLVVSDYDALADTRIGEIDETNAAVGFVSSLPDGFRNDAGSEGAELRSQNEPRVEHRTLDEFPKVSAIKCYPKAISNSSSNPTIEQHEPNAASGSAVSLSDGSSGDAGCEGAELRSVNEPQANDQAVNDAKAETAIGCGANPCDDVSDISNVTPKKSNKEQCPDLNEPVVDRDTITPETSPAKGQPFDARQIGDENNTGQTPPSGPVSLHFGDKIVKCISKLLPQSSH